MRSRWAKAILWILLPASASISGPVNPNLGLDIRLGRASHYEPYDGFTGIQFAPNAGVRLKVRRGLELGLGYEFAASSSLCFLACADRLRKISHDVRMEALFRIPFGKEGFFLAGPAAFLRRGENVYTLQDKPSDGIDYSGNLVDRYTMLGAGITAGHPVHRYFIVGLALGYWHETGRQRENTLYRVDNHGDFRGPVTYAVEDRAGYLELGLGLKAQFNPGY